MVYRAHTHTHSGVGLAGPADAGVKIAQRTWLSMRLKKAEGRAPVSLGKREVLFLQRIRAMWPEGKLRRTSPVRQEQAKGLPPFPK